MKLKSLVQEMQAKARAAKTMKDLEELANDNGQELSDEQLESLNGGRRHTYCPKEGCPFFRRY